MILSFATLHDTLYPQISFFPHGINLLYLLNHLFPQLANQPQNQIDLPTGGKGKGGWVSNKINTPWFENFKEPMLSIENLIETYRRKL